MLTKVQLCACHENKTCFMKKEPELVITAVILYDIFIKYPTSVFHHQAVT